MKNNKTMVLIISLAIVLTLTATLSFFVWNSSRNQDINVSVNLSGLDAFIHYNKGTDVLTGTLLPSTDYTGGISTEIELWKDPSAESRTIYGHIYLDITSIGTNLANEPALKWAITSNGEVLNTGNFVGKSNGNSISLKLNIPLSTSKQLFKIYIWLDESMSINDAIEGETIATVVRAEASEVMYAQNASQFITSLLYYNPDTMNNDDPDGNVRYMGADPNNYVSFNNELWRIIGVFDVASTYRGPTEKRIKIIRDESIGTYSWGDSDVNDWTQASLQEYLNGEYYNNLPSETKDLIGDAVWNLGGTASYQSSSNGLPSHFYGYERGTTVYSGRPTYWVGKIGLMYPSDYGYATSGGTTTNRASCLSKEMFNWRDSSYSDCKNNDYLYNSSSYQWTLTPYSSSSNFVFRVNMTGYVNYYLANYADSASPVLYLKSTVEITGGEGTSGNPYTLDMPSVPATETISNIYNNAEKTTVVNNSVEYQYATSVGMMEDVGGNIRYYGADPNNYVSFNNKLWRIIGVFNDIDDGTGKTETRLKIARNESIGNYAWDSNKVNEWPTATLQTYLNGDYLNGLTSEAQGMVGNAKWNLGGSSTHQGLYANDYYTFERGTTVYSGRSTEWIGKIALMYPSDYMYAGDLSKCSKDGYNWDTDQTNCLNTSWLRNTSATQWTLTPRSSNSSGVFYVDKPGSVRYNYSVANSIASRPVLYLASTVEITGGEGTSENPYTLLN